ncbi:amidase family protein [Breoghania sp. L-A4]|uniref:amidase family protein n=1 Tax=Breoghania sp. L-A4 TaxID=2304600 RepID=UPI000E35FCC7|nr:amidase family protein [Breoghania sp. L-A4]AXS38788.1 hypothetical protein D1F64_00340 [Breoghania sp. L-A4]
MSIPSRNNPTNGQAAGSTCRRAAYCGAVGFKPNFGALSTRGMTPLSPSFDSIGFIARTVALAGRAFAACGGPQPLETGLGGLRMGLAPVDPEARWRRRRFRLFATPLTRFGGGRARSNRRRSA